MNPVIRLAVSFASMISFLIIERSLRMDARSMTLKATEPDRGSTRIAAFGTSGLLLALSLPANHYRLGTIESTLVLSVVGHAAMVAGIAIRVDAARTLGKSYSRTLLIREDHKVVTRGLYRTIRHPGYLGDMLLFLGAGISVCNYIVLIAIGEYEEYIQKTKRLVPFSY
jgi:protein-S-isoprenylcysteine O-methyltransferase Ste14